MSQLYLARLSITGITNQKTPLLIYPGTQMRVLGLPTDGLVLVEVDGVQVEVLKTDLESLAVPVSESDP